MWNDLKSIGIQKGLLFLAIKKLTEVIKPYEIIVARGVPPIEGLDGDLEMHIDYKEKTPRELEKIDFRELNLIVSVEAGSGDCYIYPNRVSEYWWIVMKNENSLGCNVIRIK